jgi:hypothetical protein
MSNSLMSESRISRDSGFLPWYVSARNCLGGVNVNGDGTDDSSNTIS